MSSTEPDRRTTQALTAVTAAFGLTTVHHVYGGLVDASTGRLLVPLVLSPAVLASVGLLIGYRRTRRRGLLIAYASLSTVVFVGLLGVFHGGYAHVYKDLIFLTGAPARYYVALNPDEHFPPDDLFFEITGILEVGAATLVGLTSVRLLRGYPVTSPPAQSAQSTQFLRRGRRGRLGSELRKP